MISRLFSTQLVKSPINITKNAWGKIGSIIKKSENRNGFLFSASSGGCNGFNYNLNLIDDKEMDELKKEKIKSTFLVNGGSKVYIDSKSEFYLIGTTIDFVKEDYSNNIFESKFTFSPDKEKASSCGCGVSFSPRFQ